MRSRTISDDEFIKITRGISQFTCNVDGSLSHKQSIILLSDTYKQICIDVNFAVSYDERLRISHLRVSTYEKYLIKKQLNLILLPDHKRELYRILKALTIFRLN